MVCRPSARRTRLQFSWPLFGVRVKKPLRYDTCGWRILCQLANVGILRSSIQLNAIELVNPFFLWQSLWHWLSFLFCVWLQASHFSSSASVKALFELRQFSRSLSGPQQDRGTKQQKKRKTQIKVDLVCVGSSRKTVVTERFEKTINWESKLWKICYQLWWSHLVCRNAKTMMIHRIIDINLWRQFMKAIHFPLFENDPFLKCPIIKWKVMTSMNIYMYVCSVNSKHYKDR